MAVKDSPTKIKSELENYIRNCEPALHEIHNTMFAFLTPKLHVKWVNDLVKMYYNLPGNAFLEKSSLEQKVTGDFQNILEHLNKIEKINIEFSIHFTTTNPTQPDKLIKWSANALKSQNLNLMGIMLVGSIDFDELNLSKKKIDFLQNCIDTIVDSVPGSMYWKDKNGIYLGCNKAMVVKSNLNSKFDIIGKSDYELWPDNAPQVCQRDLEVMNDKKTIESQETVTINSGENLYFLSIKTPLCDEFKNVVGVVGNSLEITEIVKSKERAEEANNIKTQFLLNMQHDIKTPIGHIIGLSDILMKIDDKLPDEVKEYIGYINISSKRLMELITDILHFADIEAGKSPKRNKNFNLKSIITKIVELNTGIVHKKHLDIKIDYDTSISHAFYGDRDRLQRVLLNLFDNALKFTDSGTIEFSTKVLKNLPNSKVLLEIRVCDSGLGIPKEKQSVIFDRFTRLSPSSSNKYPGFGLGLWMVKKFIEEMDGQVTVESIIGKGSCFICTLPLGVR